MQSRKKQPYWKSGVWLSLRGRERTLIKRGQGGGFCVGGNVLFFDLVGGYMEIVCCVASGSLSDGPQWPLCLLEFTFVVSPFLEVWEDFIGSFLTNRRDERSFLGLGWKKTVDCISGALSVLHSSGSLTAEEASCLVMGQPRGEAQVARRHNHMSQLGSGSPTPL